MLSGVLGNVVVVSILGKGSKGRVPDDATNFKLSLYEVIVSLLGP